jgi:uncharacterized protein (UPF0264 family)
MNRARDSTGAARVATAGAAGYIRVEDGHAVRPSSIFSAESFMPESLTVALSLKQPWATLLVHGRKTIEVRRWSTPRRGRILIHAARVPDERPAAWALLSPELREFARLGGGIVGAATLTDCVTYRDRATFTADQPRHLNDPAWFRKPPLYGFQFADLRPLPFQRYSGRLYFFDVALPPEERPVARSPNLLVSVRDLGEAVAARAGGADLIDVKEPSRGSLGRADEATLRGIAEFLHGRSPLSAALGELAENEDVPGVAGLEFVKWGLAGSGPDWQPRLKRALQRASEIAGRSGVVVAYADAAKAGAPPVEEVVDFATEKPGRVLLIDTFAKGTPRRTLLDWLSVDKVRDICQRCREAEVRVALAGSLSEVEILSLLPAEPAWFAVRGAACTGGQRDARVSPQRVRFLKEMLLAHVPLCGTLKNDAVRRRSQRHSRYRTDTA